MKCTFRKSFARDVKDIKSTDLRARIKVAIEAVENADSLGALDVKKLAGAKNCYRIRVGDFRIGITVDKQQVDFVRCLHRRDIYKYFP